MIPAWLVPIVFWVPHAAPLPTGVAGATFYNTDSIRFQSPVWIGQLPSAPGALLIGEGAGRLQVLEPQGNAYRTWTFASVPAAFTAGNDGLLGVAFHPAFMANGRYYVCSNPNKGELVLAERQAKTDRRGDSGSSRVLLRVALVGVVHNGGDIHFGPDGCLYLGLGDGGNPQIYNQRSQDMTLLLGKMLRIDVDRKDAGLEYAIPADNPFAASADPAVRREIWASGLRQPWRWSFDVDGRQFVGDVGDWVAEEVDVIRKGGNYGWSRMEGSTCFNGQDETHPLATCDSAGLSGPLAVVPHVPVSTGSAACIIGGYVFRGDPASPFFGAYIFGDWKTGKLYGLPPGSGSAPVAPEVIGTGGIGMSAFGMDGMGNLYFANYTNGVISRLEHAGLVGKGVGIRGGKRRAIALRGPLGRRLQAADFPGGKDVEISDEQGRILRRYTAAQLADGVELDMPPGVYAARAFGGLAVRPIILR